MRVGVQVDWLEATRGEAYLEGRVVQPSPTEEARALDDVELAELGSEDVDDAQPGGRDVGTRDLDRIGRGPARGEPVSGQVWPLADRAS